MDHAGLAPRIAAKLEVHPDTGCWLWQGATNRDGYGIVKWEGSCKLAHRVVYVTLTGETIPDGWHLDHQIADRPLNPGPCRFRNCCNPAHIEAVPAEINRARVSRKRVQDTLENLAC